MAKFDDQYTIIRKCNLKNGWVLAIEEFETVAFASYLLIQ